MLMASTDSPPSARVWPFTASVGNVVYLWGGDGDTEPDAVFLFCRDTKTWARQRTRGPHPPAGLNGGGCCISGQHLYIYGGYDGESRYGTLYELNTKSWTWRKLSDDGAAGGPGKKNGCRIIRYQDRLLVVGGYYIERPRRQAGSSYENGWTNEVHCFNLTTGLWSSPSMKGSRPPPCSSFSLTMADKDHAVMFGGGSNPFIKSSMAHILHLPTMTWIEHEKGDPWPERRSSHIAACLGYGELHKTILVSGGWGGWDGDVTHEDMWLLDLQLGRMEELQLPEEHKKLIQRYGHGAATILVNSDCVEVILFGGRDKNDSLMADTTILRFEWQMKSEGGRWALTDIADDTQCGSPARLATKRRLMESSHTKGNMDGNVSLEQQLQEAQIREEQLQKRAEDAEWQAEEADKRAEDSERKAEDSERRTEDSERRAEDSERRAEVAEGRVHCLERSLDEITQDLRQCEDRLESYSTHWVVMREEIELTGPQLGVGGWATVTVAKFRGIKVAVKRIHNRIISHHNLQLFQREMNMAARLRHPNLIQFIGATMEGEMMIVLELMATSLRSQLEREIYFPPNTMKAIGLDVACGLNYLHLIRPDPIVHRDISSANVLLEELPHRVWRAKLTDYGSVNVVCQLHTQNPGSPAYSAPEASDPRLQSPKMDIYSFGALVLEMLTGRLPAPDDRPGLFRKVNHEQLLRLIRRCLSQSKEDRPSASDIITELSS